MSNAMSRAVMSAALAIGAMAVVGGFAPGAATAEAAPSASRFAGNWSGTWAHVEDEAVGTVDVTISDAGQIRGTVYNVTDGSGGTNVGHVGADGNLEIIAFVPNDVPGDGSGFPFRGTAVIDSDGTLILSATATYPGGASFIAILERE